MLFTPTHFAFLFHFSPLVISMSEIEKKKKTKKLIDRVPKNSLAILPILQDTYKTI